MLYHTAMYLINCRLTVVYCIVINKERQDHWNTDLKVAPCGGVEYIPALTSIDGASSAQSYTTSLHKNKILVT